MTLLQPVIELVNSVGLSATSAVTALLSVNHVLASNVVSLLTVLGTFATSALLAVVTAIRILLEDLFTFVKETSDSILSACEIVFSAVDAGVNLLVSFVNLLVGSALAVVHALGSAVTSCGQAIASSWSHLWDFFHLLGSSVFLLLNIFPRTVYVIGLNLVDLVKSSFATAAGAAAALWSGLTLTSLVGAAAGVAVSYSAGKLASKLLRGVTVASALQTLLNMLLFLYLNFVRGLILVFLCITTTLTHLHVPRFHHAGDSDAEEEEVEEEGVVVGQYDSSDNEENDRIAEKWRNYNLLLQRRDQKLKNRLNRAKGEAAEDVEEMLFEQVEREREDKLCVICQDREKCIMILPCRHLCICQECQGPLRVQGNNKCPICRKNVRQTIKAYL